MINLSTLDFGIPPVKRTTTVWDLCHTPRLMCFWSATPSLHLRRMKTYGTSGIQKLITTHQVSHSFLLAPSQIFVTIQKQLVSWTKKVWHQSHIHLLPASNQMWARIWHISAWNALHWHKRVSKISLMRLFVAQWVGLTAVVTRRVARRRGVNAPSSKCTSSFCFIRHHSFSFFPPLSCLPLPPQLWELGEEKTRKIEEGKLMTKMIINTQTQQQQITNILDSRQPVSCEKSQRVAGLWCFFFFLSVVVCVHTHLYTPHILQETKRFLCIL